MKPILFNTEMVRAILDGRKTQTRRIVKPRHGGHLELHDDVGGVTRLCERDGPLCRGLKPPYDLGDILWVRETWCRHGNPDAGRPMHYDYRADREDPARDDAGFIAVWRPSIHMPKEASRLFLRVTDVRVDRLQNITIDDAIAEGCNEIIPITEFRLIWSKTIKPANRDRYGWHANPWVWVISFERYDPADPEGGADNC